MILALLKENNWFGPDRKENIMTIKYYDLEVTEFMQHLLMRPYENLGSFLQALTLCVTYSIIDVPTRLRHSWGRNHESLTAGRSPKGCGKVADLYYDIISTPSPYNVSYTMS
jgi:hypothetical protein